MIRRSAAFVLAAFLAATVSLAAPAFSDNSRPIVGTSATTPQVSCEAVQSGTTTTRYSEAMAKRFNRTGWRMTLRLESQRDKIQELRAEIRRLKRG